jgi:sortase B
MTQKKRRIRIAACLAVISIIFSAVCAFKAVPYLSDLWGFRREQAELSKLSPFDVEQLEINPDYVGWLRVDGTKINFPVVRGSDNIKYLNTTFRGAENRLGAIFMDYRCEGEISQVPHIIIYGHQISDESYSGFGFGELQYFTDKQYLSERPTIRFMSNDSVSEFEIFSARKTDIHDPAYLLDFSDPDSWEAFLDRNDAPTDAEQIITLSTCIGVDNDRRMIIQGTLKSIVQVKTEYGETGWRVVNPQ